MLAEIEERKDMFEYNVKKNAEDRKENKILMAKMSANY